MHRCLYNCINLKKMFYAAATTLLKAVLPPLHPSPSNLRDISGQRVCSPRRITTKWFPYIIISYTKPSMFSSKNYYLAICCIWEAYLTIICWSYFFHLANSKFKGLLCKWSTTFLRYYDAKMAAMPKWLGTWLCFFLLAIFCMWWIICSFSKIMFDRAEKQHEWNDLIILHHDLAAMMKGFVTNTNIRLDYRLFFYGNSIRLPGAYAPSAKKSYFKMSKKFNKIYTCTYS
jgi:hypothetical protein